ncbi:plasmid stabilization protein [Clostridia bacterium]|nr:plasmid stabilization protein [Clostridia bacterium]
MKTEYTKRAVKSIKSMDSPTKQRIRQAINDIPQGDIKPLRGADGIYRLRVGDWRIVFTYPDDDIVKIDKIAPRGQVYKEM